MIAKEAYLYDLVTALIIPKRQTHKNGNQYPVLLENNSQLNQLNCNKVFTKNRVETKRVPFFLRSQSLRFNEIFMKMS